MSEENNPFVANDAWWPLVKGKRIPAYRDPATIPKDETHASIFLDGNTKGWARVLGEVDQLEQLSIRGRVTDTVTDPISSLVRLRKLSISFAQNTRLDFLAGMQQLETLHLNGSNKASDHSPLSHLHALRVLEIGISSDTKDLEPFFGCLPTSLEALRLASYPARKIAELSSLKGLRLVSNLSALGLVHIYTDDGSLEELRSLKRLKVLWLTKHERWNASHLADLISEGVTVYDPTKI